MRKYVIYTVITGGFDEIRQPLVLDNRFDYILFSDTITDRKVGVWLIRKIDFKHSNSRILSRYPKTNPCMLLWEYEASLYIDGNIQISSKNVYDRCVDLAGKGIEWAGINHQGRVGMFDEINAIIGLGWVHDYEVLDWYKFLRKERFPDDNGMFENNIIFRTHKSDNVKAVCDIWWETIRETKVKRDQFSLMYALWKVGGVRRGFFLPEDENAWHNNGLFLCENHNPHNRVLKKNIWEKLRDRYVRKYYWDGGWEVFYTHWFDKLIKWPFPHLMMHIWTARIAICYDSKFLLGRGWKRIIP